MEKGRTGGGTYKKGNLRRIHVYICNVHMQTATVNLGIKYDECDEHDYGRA